LLNFAKLNPLTADFHLMVDTSDKLDIAIRKPSGQRVSRESCASAVKVS
jgi:hypothetical protein